MLFIIYWLFKTVVYNGDYSNEKLVNMFQDGVNDKIAFWQKIEADELVEDFKNGVLKGRLKEIAAGLDEESNPVLMLVKFKVFIMFDISDKNHDFCLNY